MSEAIQVSKLSKRYPGAAADALHDLTLSVKAGEVYGYLGANGAGKTTTIRLLLNFIRPSRGQASILGRDIVSDSAAVKRSVGYLSGEIALYPKATARQFLDYMNRLQPPRHAAYLDRLVKSFEAELDKPMATLSKGNRQKIGLLQAFMHEPDVLILDEPTSGLDPLMQEEFFGLIQESRERGAAIFLSSHNLAETQRICDRVGIIKAGKLIREQTIDELSDLAHAVYRITLGGAADVAKLQASKQLKLVSRIDGHTLLARPSGSLAGFLATVSRVGVREFTSQQTDLESEFMEFYEDKP